MKIKQLTIFLFIGFPGFAQSEIISEEITIYNDSIELPGTLTYPTKSIKIPLIIWVHGSGNVDRHGNQKGINIKANYIKQFRDSINVHAAFFSYDKRTATLKNLKQLQNSSFNDLVTDVQKVIHNFRDDPRFSEIVLAGHSQGSLVGMLAVNESVNKFISIAGLGQSADKAIIRQVKAQNEELGKITEQHINELISTGTIKEVNSMLAVLFAKQNHKFLIDYFKYDPQEIIKKIKIPILILNGDKDIQVGIEDAKKLYSANPSSNLVIVKNMNHVLKNIDNEEDNLKSYYSDNFPLSGEFIRKIRTFIKE